MPNPRKPTALKKLQGTLNPTRAKRDRFEPEVETDLDVIPPTWLSASQKAGWHYILQHAPKGLLKSLDRGSTSRSRRPGTGLLEALSVPPAAGGHGRFAIVLLRRHHCQGDPGHLATASETSRNGRRPMSAVIHIECPSDLPDDWRMTTVVPIVKSRRRYRSPCFGTRPSFCLPLACCRGTSPIQAASSRPSWPDRDTGPIDPRRSRPGSDHPFDG